MPRLGSENVRRVVASLRQENGSSLIELGLILPVVFLMTFGFIEFCLVVFGIGNANIAGRIALRYATLHSATSYSPTTQSDLNKIGSSYIFPYPSNTYSITPSYYSSNTVGSAVCIAVSVTYHFTAFRYTSNAISYGTIGCGAVQQ